MIREFHLADFFTLANAACGVAAIFFALAYVDDELRVYFYAAAAMAFNSAPEPSPEVAAP